LLIFYNWYILKSKYLKVFLGVKVHLAQYCNSMELNPQAIVSAQSWQSSDLATTWPQIQYAAKSCLCVLSINLEDIWGSGGTAPCILNLDTTWGGGQSHASTTNCGKVSQ
jgi:hypothetical protein